MREIKLASKAIVFAGFFAIAMPVFAQETGETTSASAQVESEVHWSPEQLVQLRQWIASSGEDALPAIPMAPLDEAIASADPQLIDHAATALALKLARMHLVGTTGTSARRGWHIEDTDAKIDLDAWLKRALAAGGVDSFFSAMQPQPAQYALLREALANEANAQRRKAIANNMERWRWMPRSLGKDYILVNAASFTAGLWRDGQQVGEWRVIVGKRSTPTPVFSATVTGVIINPWWNIPASIVREKRGSFPARLGYVRSGSGWRQKPGPANALGQMKLAMPNPYNVYMHDTPSKHLFEKKERAYSHGCIRTADALGFAATLLQGVKSRAEIDAIVTSRKTTEIDLAASIPVYITYFTASAAPDGTVTVHDDIYNRDRGFTALAATESECSLSGKRGAG